MSESLVPGRLPEISQLYRLQYLLQWLRDGRVVNTRRAAEAFEVSARTIASDIAYLRLIGVPLAFDRRRNSYVLEEPFDNLPLVSLRQTELATFLVAQHALEALGDAGHANLLAGVVERLARHLPETIHVEPEALARWVRFEPGPHPRVRFQWFEALEEAVRVQRIIEMRYFSNHRGEENERAVDPYTLLNHQGRWYLIGYCHWRKEVRDFRLDRIRALSVSDDIFAVPPDFDLEAYLGPAFGMHRGERTYAVHVRFSAYQARWIAEEQWHPSQVLVRRQDGTLDVRMQVTGLTDVARWVLSYGGEAEAVSPPLLRHRVAREARRMAALYADVGPVEPDAEGN